MKKLDALQMRSVEAGADPNTFDIFGNFLFSWGEKEDGVSFFELAFKGLGKFFIDFKMTKANEWLSVAKIVKIGFNGLKRGFGFIFDFSAN